MLSDVISIQLDHLLDARGITLYRLSKDTGINYETLRKIKGGKVTRIYLETIEKLCEALSCTPNDLLVIEK